MHIGIDVGGTNTDAVLMQEHQVIASIKTGTTADVTSGIVQALREVLRLSAVSPGAVQSVMIGTTHFTNAIIERKKLLEVGVIRIGAPATLSLPPFTGWPEGIRDVLDRFAVIIPGGFNFDGREIAAFDEAAALKAIRQIKRRGLRAIAISCVFSPVNPEMEERVAALARDIIPDVQITLSSDIGRVGFLERENAAILNASLGDLAHQVVHSFRQALAELNINAPFYISQNDGTLMAAAIVERFPVLTIASGPTNSMRGAAFLTGKQDAIIVDIGGTTSDIGMVAQGFPRESAVSVDIGGVRTNFRMPDILAIGLGGGSKVRLAKDAALGAPSIGKKISIGPDSVAYELIRDALVFGGSVLTVTDIAVAAGLMQVGDPAKVKHLGQSFVAAAMEEIHLRLENAIDRMKTSPLPVAVVLVGGGSSLISRKLRGVSEIVRPEYAGVANAIGAAIAQVGGEVDRVYSYGLVGRDNAIAEAREEALAKARSAGAKTNLRILDIEEVPISYVPGGAVRLRVKAIGDLTATPMVAVQREILS